MQQKQDAADAQCVVERGGPRAGFGLRAWRYVRLALHLVVGVLTVLVVYPLSGRTLHRRYRQRWSRRLLRALGVELQVEGEPVVPGALIVANHVSWLDIFVLNALVPAAFVSKAEVRTWPVLGWLAGRNETVFLRRGSRGHAKIVNGEIAALLDAGRNVALFPEGTTTDGSHVLHFHAALLQPAIESGHPVQPVALSYRAADGARSAAPAYVADVSLLQCLAAIVAEPRLTARTWTGPALSTGSGNRRELAQSARARIVEQTGRE